MNFHVLTLFPEMVLEGLNTSIIGRAIKNGKINIDAVNIRDFTSDKHGKVDDYSYGGGAGMLMQADPVYGAYESVKKNISSEGISGRTRCVYVTPQGSVFNQDMAADFAKEEDLIILCGHYEGIDERVLEEIVTDYVSIGDYVLTGGELAAMVMIDSISRLVPGVLHNGDSSVAESFHGELLEYPQYSRPEIWHGKSVPKELLTGNPKIIDAYRREEQIKRTKERRPDLYERFAELEKAKSRMQKADRFLNIDMIEHINRGTGKLVYMDDDQIIIEDKKCGILFHTSTVKNDGEYDVGKLADVSDFLKNAPKIVFHQLAEVKKYQQKLNININFVCKNVVYTQREKLPVSGLYMADGSPLKSGENAGMYIRELDENDIPDTLRHYTFIKDATYTPRAVREGRMYGAFFKDDSEEKMAGFIGIHENGTMGMLEVFEEYKRRHLGTALATYIMNVCLNKGYIPYAQISEDNMTSLEIAKRRGMCMSKTAVYWTDKIK